MNDDRLAAARAELDRQNEDIEAFARALRELGDVELAVSHDVLEELDAATRPRIPAAPSAGIRG